VILAPNKTSKCNVKLEKIDDLLTEHPINVLGLGQDTGGLVGDYKKDFKLSVPLKSATITLK